MSYFETGYEYDVDGRARVTTDEERVRRPTSRTLNRDGYGSMKVV